MSLADQISATAQDGAPVTLADNIRAAGAPRDTSAKPLGPQAPLVCITQARGAFCFQGESRSQRRGAGDDRLSDHITSGEDPHDVTVADVDAPIRVGVAKGAPHDVILGPVVGV